MNNSIKGSGNFSFGAYEMRKVLKGFGIAVLGSILAYILSDVIPLFKDTPYMILIPLMSTVVNIAKEWVKNNENRSL